MIVSMVTVHFLHNKRMMDLTENMSHKDAHELFVSGHAGTTVSEIAVIISSCPVAVLLREVVRRALLNRRWSLNPRQVVIKYWLSFRSGCLIHNGT